MEINYTVIGLLLIAILILIFFLVRRNMKDKKTFEQQMYESEMKPEKHGDDETRI